MDRGGAGSAARRVHRRGRRFRPVLRRAFRQGEPGGLGDIFAQFRRAAGSAAARRAPPPRRRHGRTNCEIPFATSITGGEVQLAVQRPSGKAETMRVKIPAGNRGRQEDPRPRPGRAGRRGGTPGDILITIHVRAAPVLSRRGNNLYVRVPLTLGEAAAGAKIDVPTPTGTVALTIPPGTSSGTKFRIKGHGVAAGGPRPATCWPRRRSSCRRTSTRPIAKR